MRRVRVDVIGGGHDRPSLIPPVAPVVRPGHGVLGSDQPLGRVARREEEVRDVRGGPGEREGARVRGPARRGACVVARGARQVVGGRVPGGAALHAPHQPPLAADAVAHGGGGLAGRHSRRRPRRGVVQGHASRGAPVSRQHRPHARLLQRSPRGAARLPLGVRVPAAVTLRDVASDVRAGLCINVAAHRSRQHLHLHFDPLGVHVEVGLIRKNLSQ